MRIKLSGNVIEVTLLVHGRERTFTEKQLIAALEKAIPKEATDEEKQSDDKK